MDAAKEFADLKFKAECGEMILRQIGGSHLVIQGPGEIWQDEDGALQFKIFAREGYRGLNTYMGRPGVIGQPIPAEDFFTLHATDYTLPTWTAQQILPAPRGGLLDGFAHGYINELVQSTEVPVNREHDYIAARFKGKLDFPCNQGTRTEIWIGDQLRGTRVSRNVAFVEDGNYRFELTHESEHTLVSLQLPAGQLSLATPSRIRESLQFVLGRELALMAVETISGNQRVIRLISPIAERGRGKMLSPLEFGTLDVGGHVWRMFVNYFQHVHRNNSPGLHPISRHINSAIESTAASLEAEVLALAVAVEGLIGECFPNLAPVSENFLGELNVVATSLAATQISEPTRNRITGSINAMRQTRNSDLLRAFISSRHLPTGLYGSWSRLRNVSAHGGGIGERDIATILQMKNEVLSLLYSIVFATINYAGPRTDYSLPNWPQTTWLPNATPALNATPPPSRNVPEQSSGFFRNVWRRLQLKIRNWFRIREN